MSELSPETREELKKLISDGVKSSVRDIGLTDAEVFELRKDLTFLREQRLTCEKIKTHGVVYSMMILLTGLAGIVALGFKGWISLP